MKIDINSKINIDSRTELYAVIGDPIAHSLSPVFQNYFIEQRNMDAVYIPLRITSDTLGDSLKILRDNFAGFNVTVPHKENIMQYLDEIDPLAVEYGAVNTVKVVGDMLMGYNTDGQGFTKSIENMNINPGGKKILLLGAGGAAKVIAHEIIKSGGSLIIANRNIERGMQIKEQLETFYNVSVGIISSTEFNTSPDTISPIESDVSPGIANPPGADALLSNAPFDIIINSTSAGMYPDTDGLPIKPDVLRNAELVYDVIYNPLETKLLGFGKKFGAETMNGLHMLIYQGLESFKIWTGEQATYEEKKNIYKKLQDILSINEGG